MKKKRAIVLIFLFFSYLGFSEDRIGKAKEYYQKAMESYSYGKLRRAVDYFLKSYRIYPHPDIVYNIAKIYDKLGEDEKAIEYYKKYLKVKKGLDKKEKEEIKERIKKIEERKRRVELALKLKPPSKKVILKATLDFYKKGVKLYKKGYLKAAFEAFKSAYNLTPIPELLYNMALCMEKEGDIDIAIEFYKKYYFEIDDKETKKLIKKHIRELKERRDKLFKPTR